MPFYAREVSPSAVPVRTGLADLKMVGFPNSPVTAVSRPLANPEHWALYHFECHAVKCHACYRPYEVHRAGGKLCQIGHELAQDVAGFLFSKDDGTVVYGINQKHVRVEIPEGYFNVVGLLRAMERSLRLRSPRPLVSYDRTYPVPMRTQVRAPSPPRSKASSKSGGSPTPKPKETYVKRKPEIVDWPEHETEFREPSVKSEPIKRISAPEKPRHATPPSPKTSEKDLLQRRQSAFVTRNVPSPTPSASSSKTPQRGSKESQASNEPTTPPQRKASPSQKNNSPRQSLYADFDVEVRTPNRRGNRHSMYL